MTISLEPHGNSFLLSGDAPNGSKSEIVLSETDIMMLAQSAQRWTQHILEQRSKPEAGLSALASTPVAQIRLNTDVHGSEILLSLIDGNGAEVTFALAPEVARPLAERLPIRLAEIETKKTRQ
jgi:hypothetical protein